MEWRMFILSWRWFYRSYSLTIATTITLLMHSYAYIDLCIDSYRHMRSSKQPALHHETKGIRNSKGKNFHPYLRVREDEFWVGQVMMGMIGGLGGGYLVEFELEEMKSWSLLGGGWRIDGGRGEAEFCVVGICK